MEATAGNHTDIDSVVEGDLGDDLKVTPKVTPWNVSELCVAEFSVQGRALELPQVLQSQVFEIRTCQRTILIGHRQVLQPFIDSASSLSISVRRFFEGAPAYHFLLRFSCGLESEIKGETDVFGQIKIAFKALSQKLPTLAASLDQIMQRLFEDTKDVRANYLQGIGGNTYGALSRRILLPQLGDRVLIIGAGQISKSVAPYFAEFDLKIWNRSTERLEQLGAGLEKKGYRSITLLNESAQLAPAILEADVIIIGTPCGSEIDAEILATLKENQNHPTLMHLGGPIEMLGHFSSYPRFHSLSSLFEIEKAQNIFREKQVQQASDACHHRSILRGMARSMTIPHGWEDLALFY